MAYAADCLADVSRPPLALMPAGHVADDAWPPRRVAARLIASRSALECYKPGSDRCAACRFAMELPLALARAADDAALEGSDDAAHGLIAKAFHVADLLLDPAPLEWALARRAPVALAACA